MNLRKIILIFFCSIALYSCADYKTNEVTQKKEKQYYSSNGFALIYDDELFLQKTINKKINNEDIRVMHSLLKTNTPLKIINPINSKVIETKVYKKAKYPKIFNVVISKKIASILELDVNNPYVEVIEIKKNKIFIAKKASTFEEEKNTFEKKTFGKINTFLSDENLTLTFPFAPQGRKMVLFVRFSSIHFILRAFSAVWSKNISWENEKNYTF